MDRIEIKTAAGATFYLAMFRTDAQRAEHVAMARSYPQWSDAAQIVVTSAADLDAENARYEAVMAARRAAGVPDWRPLALASVEWQDAWDNGPGAEA